jgi:hypothetical protein
MTNNKQQTAVEWLEQEMLKPNLSMKEILEQAKEMEKEQKRIKLPSDEEISEESYDVFGKESRYHVHILQYKAFKIGAKWMRDKIQGGNR